MADVGCTAPRFQTDAAARKRDQGAEGEALGQPEHDLIDRYGAARLRDEQSGRNIQHGDAGEFAVAPAPPTIPRDQSPGRVALR